jgi:hypothetical protein
MPHSPSPSTQREALVNCTNVTSEPIHNIAKLPTPPVHGLFKRSRPADDSGTRLKRLKFSIGESRPVEDERADGVDSDSSEEEEDNSNTFCAARRKRTIFHAKNALAMSRPGVTCRPLPCEPNFYRGTILSLTIRSTDPLTPPRIRIISQDRCVHVQFGQGGLVLDTTIRLRIHSRYVPPLGM